MIEIKLYLYNSSQEANGYRGTDYSQYVMQGMENVEDLTQELDTTQLTLWGINQANAFDPTTKFIIDIYSDGNLQETLHRIVQNDYVTQPILEDNTQYKHEISFIEPSAIAQKRLVDNIACTYKLKDVSLATQVTYDINADSVPTNTKDNYSAPSYFVPEKCTAKKLVYDGQVKMVNENSVESIKRYQDYATYAIGGNHNARFSIPKLKIYQYKETTPNTFDYVYIGDASIVWSVIEYNLDDTPSGNKWSGEIISKSNLGGNSYDNGQSLAEVANEVVLYQTQPLTPHTRWKYKRYTNVNAQTEPSYFTSIIPISADKLYRVTIALNNSLVVGNATLENYNGVPTNYCSAILKGTTFLPYRDYYRANFNVTKIYCGEEKTTMINDFITYTNASKQEVLTSGQPYPALLLIEKAICNSVVKEKIANVQSGNLNYEDNDGKLAYNSAFYIDGNFMNDLISTQVIENFYSQKNLWEILLEVGNYIHAIPEIKFGANDKFLITFTRLGQTEETSGDAQKISVTNFRSIDDYIAETDSYVSNLVQLGGYIDEWVAPKNSDDNFLTYNDTAEIITSKPIIELLGLQIKANKAYADVCEVGQTTLLNGTRQDATTYIFEENVYKILPIVYNQFPNKGTSMYYKLQTNKIIGGNYQLPQASTNVYSDYSIKKLIYCAFTGTYPTPETPPVYDAKWSNICVLDFSFRVIYRTSDSARLSHSRPDLRKYLVNSKFDEMPQLKQFNNQQDTLIDSQKFGANMYGTLIRTGNLNYTMQEWCTKPSQLKKKGEIFLINGVIYYVAKTTNTYYSDMILSSVEYTKDYNQLSKVIGIPSEPRFYEISEQSSIQREVSIDEYMLFDLDGEETGEQTSLRTIEHLKDLIIGSTTKVEFAKYAMTTYKGDKDIGAYASTFGDPTLETSVLQPINAYSCGTTLTYEWDNVDNYSAGDFVKPPVLQERELRYDGDKYYSALEAYKYTDQYGKATLMDFYILKDVPSLTAQQIKDLPKTPYSTNKNDANAIYNENVLASNVLDNTTDTHSRGLVLLKDNRETISINYNIHAISRSDQFVVAPFFFTPKEDSAGNPVKCKLVLLSEEVNKLSNGYFKTSSVVVAPRDFTTSYGTIADTWHSGQTLNVLLNIDIDTCFSDVSSETFENVKAVALIYDYDANAYTNKFVIARNTNTNDKALTIRKWNVRCVNKNNISNHLQ